MLTSLVQEDLTETLLIAFPSPKLAHASTYIYFTTNNDNYPNIMNRLHEMAARTPTYTSSWSNCKKMVKVHVSK